LYEGNFVVNHSLLCLASLHIQLDHENKDCLHFSKIQIPTQIYHLNIESIEAEIEEEADWIGKIDPYITIMNKNRQLFKSDYLDNIGAHPIWSNINLEVITGKC